MDINKIKKTIYNILIYIFLPTFISYCLSKVPYSNNKIFLNFYNLIPVIITLVIMIHYNKELWTNKKEDFKKNYKKYIPIMIKYYLCGFLLMNLSSAILLYLTKSMPQNEEANREIFKVLPLYATINAGIIGPICEEIAFRGSFKQFIKNKTTFLLLTSFIFGLAHVIFNLDLINIFPYAFLGFFLALAYYETDNLFVSIAMHMFHNILCIILIFI